MLVLIYKNNLDHLLSKYSRDVQAFERKRASALTTCCESYSTEGHHSSDRPCQRFLDNVFRSS